MRNRLFGALVACLVISSGSWADPGGNDPAPPAWEGRPGDDFYPREPQGPAFVPKGRRYYGRMDYLLWWAKDQEAPLLLSRDGVALIGPGPLHLDDDERHGARFTFGRWLTAEQTAAVEGTFLFLGERNRGIAERSSGATVLTRPYFDLGTGTESALLIAGPNRVGGLELQALSRLWSVEINVRQELVRNRWGHFDVLAGARYFDLDENLNVLSHSTALGTTTLISDRFGGRNQFYSGQLGVAGEVYLDRFYVNAWGKCALGHNEQQIDVAGTTVTAGAGGATVAGSGLLALAGNSGRHGHGQFAVLPEAGVNVGWRVNDHVRVSAGYTILYLVNSVRPGDHIDRAIDPASRAASFRFRQSDYWAQGLNLGFEFRY